jgi:hypothetical protein
VVLLRGRRRRPGWRLGRQRLLLLRHGQERRGAAAERRAEVLLFADDFHRARLWPKAYTVDEDDQFAVYTEVSFDLEHGVADDQLGQFIASGLFTGLRFFEALAEHLGMEDAEGDAS